jgi:NAD(P)H-dependent FMN reductase
MSVPVAVIVGSLRKESYTRKIANGLIALAPKSLNCRFVEIGDLGLYSEDADENPPAAWTRFRDEIRAVNGVLFATPEYNRSVPGVLKNAVDVGSRPQGKSVWDGLPAAVVSVTPHKLGAFGANHALRQSFVFLNMPALQQPEVYIGGAADLLDKHGKVANGDTIALLTKFMATFEKWIATTGRHAR